MNIIENLKKTSIPVWPLAVSTVYAFYAIAINPNTESLRQFSCISLPLILLSLILADTLNDMRDEFKIKPSLILVIISLLAGAVSAIITFSLWGDILYACSIGLTVAICTFGIIAYFKACHNPRVSRSEFKLIDLVLSSYFFAIYSVLFSIFLDNYNSAICFVVYTIMIITFLWILPTSSRYSKRRN